MKMKKIIATTTMMVMLISNSMNAAAKNTPEVDGLRKAVDQMLASFEESTKALATAIEDEQQMMAKFDNILDNIKYGIQQTTKDGRIPKLLTKEVTHAKWYAKWCEKQGESRYTELAVEFEKKAGLAQTQLDSMLILNAQLVELHPVIEGDKRYYHKVFLLGNMEIARKAVDDSNAKMQKVIDILKQMNEKEIKIVSK
jgi:hypothetical protein